MTPNPGLLEDSDQTAFPPISRGEDWLPNSGLCILAHAYVLYVCIMYVLCMRRGAAMLAGQGPMRAVRTCIKMHPATVTSYYQSKATGRATIVFFVSRKTVTQNGGETEGLRHDR